MTASTPMHLHVVTPDEVVVHEPVEQVSAEAANGSFTLLPRHIDVVAALVPGLLVYVTDHGTKEHLLAVDGGVLVKRGPRVRVATPEAIPGDSVMALQRAFRSTFEELADRERQARTALAHLETDAVRRLMELEDHG